MLHSVSIPSFEQLSQWLISKKLLVTPVVSDLLKRETALEQNLVLDFKRRALSLPKSRCLALHEVVSSVKSVVAIT